jgi:predicted ribosome quality control (RQC) complex YloA/Tae2 family protein
MISKAKPMKGLFRKFLTSNGTVIMAGKSAEQNEIIVGDFQNKTNIIMHTAKPGSPFCVITEKPKIGDEKETALLCAKKSQDWRDNKSDVLVHIFTGKDVYKKKEMPLGTFGVKKFKVVKLSKNEIEKFKA